jgi:hypothetical protein
VTVTRMAAMTYDGLPISSGGAHSLRTRGFRAGFDALQSFAGAVSLDPVPTNLVVEVLKGKGVPERFTSQLGSDFDERLVQRAARRVGDCTSRQWTVAPASLQWVIHTLEQFRPIPKTKSAGHAALVHATWNLVLFDSSHRPLPYQGREHYRDFDCDSQRFLGHSFVYGRVSEQTTANLFLSLPYDDVNGDVQRVVRQIQEHFPARLSSSHWKMWRLAKNGQRYVGRKISAPL